MATAQWVEFGVKSTEAIANLKSKINLPSDRWDKYKGSIHARGFSVAGATKLALVNDIHRAVDLALENGETITSFRKRFDEIVQEHGWEYKGSRGWRTSLIYNTNKKTARAAGKWAQIERVKKRRPFLKYIAVDDNKLRDLHREWYEKPTVLPVDDSFWNTHYPPNGWGCRCSVRQLSQRDLDREGVSISDRPDLDLDDVVNAKTGEVYKDIPKGIDVGWDHNTGKAWLGTDKALGQQIMQLPKAVRDDVLKDAAPRFAKENGASWREWLKVVKATKRPQGLAHSVGLLTPGLIKAIENKGVDIKSALVVADDKTTTHLKGRHKPVDKAGEDKAIPESVFNDLPKHMVNYKVALWDIAKQNIILVLDNPKGKKESRAAIEINWKTRGRNKLVTNSVKSLGLVQKSALTDKNNYEVIDGGWK